MLWCALGIAAVSIATPVVSEQIFDKWFSFPEILLLARMAAIRKQDAAFVREAAGRLGLPLHVESRPVEREAKAIGASFEAFARAARNGHRAVVVAIQAELWYRERCGRGTEAGHLDTRRVIAEGARRFGRPVLLLHGDSHFYLNDRPVVDVPNLRRVMVPGDKDIRAVLVRVDPAAAEPFAFELIGATDRPASPQC